MANLGFEFPPELTKKAWDKNKGVIAKLVVGKTDLGANLDALEKTFKVSGLGAIEPFGGVDPVEFKNYLLETVQKANQGVGPVVDKLKSLTQHAKVVHDGFSKNNKVPQSSVAYVKKIMDTSTWMASVLPKYPAMLPVKLKDEYMKHLPSSNEALSLTACVTTAKNTYKAIEEQLKKVETTPTIANVKKTFAGNGPHRQLTTTFKTWDQMALKSFPSLAKTIFAGSAMATFFKLPWLADIGNEANGAASKKLEALVKAGKPEAQVVKAFVEGYRISMKKSQVLVDYFVAAEKAVKQIKV